MLFRIKPSYFILALIFLALIAAAAYFAMDRSAPAQNDQVRIETFTLKNSEIIPIARAEKPEKGLVLLIANGTNPKINENYAKKFAALSYYVAIIDNAHLLSKPPTNANNCLNLADELNAIGMQLQTHLKLSPDELTILTGVEEGAATVYAALAQADKKKFHAAVGINFPQKLKVKSTLCSQENFITSTSENSQTLADVKRLPTSFYVFQNKNAPTIASKDFTSSVGNLKLTQEDSTEQALSEAIQILQWLDPRLADQISSDASDSDLPIIEVPVDEPENDESKSNGTQADEKVDEKAINQKSSETLAILITGDGGWAAIDKNIAKILANHGIPTIGFDALSYFWKARTPEETTADIETVINQYLEKWNKKHVVLIGYSFGADVLPFIANNLTEENKKKLALIALLGMGKTAAFEFRLSSWMNADKDASRLPILPEIEKMQWANTICIYGLDDPSANCLPAQPFGIKTISMPGDHHFDEKYEELVQHLIENIKINK